MAKTKKIKSKVDMYHHNPKRHTAIENIRLADRHNIFGLASDAAYLIKLILENGLNDDQQLVSELYSIYKARDSFGLASDASYHMEQAVERAIKRKKYRYR